MNTANGAQAQIWNFVAGGNQEWTLERIDPDTAQSGRRAEEAKDPQPTPSQRKHQNDLVRKLNNAGKEEQAGRTMILNCRRVALAYSEEKVIFGLPPRQACGLAGVFFHGRGRSEKRHFPQKQNQKENAMNLGAFMNPEFPIFSTTLCYLERDDAYLMLHRIKKQDDYNHDKWIGVGGKFERFESPEDCLLREVKEETGLTLKRFRARGLLTFIWGNMTEFIHLYTADEWTGEMVQGDACREGVLEWVPKDKAAELPIWEGDKIFFRLLNEERPYFSLKLVYEGDTLTQAVLDGKRIV